MLCAAPADYKLFLLDNFDLYWGDVDDFELFCFMKNYLSSDETCILLNDVDFTQFDVAVDNQNGDQILYNRRTHQKLDKFSYERMTKYLRTLHGIHKNTEKAQNLYARKLLIECARNATNQQNKPFESILLPLIISMVNCEQFKYTYETVWELTMFQFMSSVRKFRH